MEDNELNREIDYELLFSTGMAVECAEDKSVPIIAMTANAFADDVMKTRRGGMNEHIAKPVDLNNLSRVLDRWLNQY